MMMFTLLEHGNVKGLEEMRRAAYESPQGYTDLAFRWDRVPPQTQRRPRTWHVWRHQDHHDLVHFTELHCRIREMGFLAVSRSKSRYSPERYEGEKRSSYSFPKGLFQSNDLVGNRLSMYATAS